MKNTVETGKKMAAMGFKPKPFRKCPNCKKRMGIHQLNSTEWWCIRCTYGVLYPETKAAHPELWRTIPHFPVPITTYRP